MNTKVAEDLTVGDHVLVAYRSATAEPFTVDWIIVFPPGGIDQVAILATAQDGSGQRFLSLQYRQQFEVPGW